VFSGVITQSACLVPKALFHALPRDPQTWLALLRLEEDGVIGGPLHLMTDGMRSVAKASSRMVLTPWESVDWSLEVATKGLRLIDQHLGARVGC
jgi:hypothetical protein